MPQKLAAQLTLRPRVANFVEKFPNVGTNSHAWCTRGNRVLVVHVDVVMTIVDVNYFALNNVTVTLFNPLCHNLNFAQVHPNAQLNSNWRHSKLRT